VGKYEGTMKEYKVIRLEWGSGDSMASKLVNELGDDYEVISQSENGEWVTVIAKKIKRFV
jgi:hypothetical protein